MKHEAYIGLGSNRGDRLKNLRFAVDALAQTGEMVALSAIYETAPVGGPLQPDFWNMVAWLRTDATPHQLLTRLQRIETAAGRQRLTRNGPRTLDLDLLRFDDIVVCDARLTLPHPRMYARRFVVEPLLEVNPDLPGADWNRVRAVLAGQRVRRLAPIAEEAAHG